MRREGVCEDRLFVVGNTIVEVLIEYKKFYETNYIFSKFKLPNKYAVLTLHRPANVDNPEELLKTLNILNEVGMMYDFQLVFPIHPRTGSKIQAKNLILKHLHFIERQGYIDFIALTVCSCSNLYIFSGGIQEEACILNKPCITLRENTERPETLQTRVRIS